MVNGIFISKEMLLLFTILSFLWKFRYLAYLFVGFGLSYLCLPLFLSLMDNELFSIFLFLSTLSIGFLISHQLSQDHPLLFSVFLMAGILSLYLYLGQIPFSSFLSNVAGDFVQDVKDIYANIKAFRNFSM